MPGYISIEGDTKIWTLGIAGDLETLKAKGEFPVTAPLDGTMLVADATTMGAPSVAGGPTGWVMGDGSYLYVPSPETNKGGPAPYQLAEDWAKVAGEIKNAMKNGTKVHIQLASVGSTLLLDGKTLPFAVAGKKPAGLAPDAQPQVGEMPPTQTQQPS